MKVKCENVVICGNYKCGWNYKGRCSQDAVALDATGKCVLEKPRTAVRETAGGQRPENF